MEHKMKRDCREGPRGGFRHVLPFLAIPLAIGVMRGFARHKFAHIHSMRREGWKDGVPPMFAEWHKRAHAAGAEAEKPAEEQA